MSKFLKRILNVFFLIFVCANTILYGILCAFSMSIFNLRVYYCNPKLTFLDICKAIIVLPLAFIKIFLDVVWKLYKQVPLKYSGSGFYWDGVWSFAITDKVALAEYWRNYK